MEIRFPLFVRAKDSGEIRKFTSVYELQKLEEIDVENEEYEVWDRNGLPVQLKLQEPVWIKLETLADVRDSVQLRRALLAYAESLGVQLSDDLPVTEFETALAQLTAAQEKKLLAQSAVRRFFAHLKRRSAS